MERCLAPCGQALLCCDRLLRIRAHGGWNEPTARQFNAEYRDAVDSLDRDDWIAYFDLDDGLREDCISLATGAWFAPQIVEGRRIDVHGNPNVLTVDIGASELSQGNIAHTATVRIEKFDGPLADVNAHAQPSIVAQTKRPTERP